MISFSTDPVRVRRFGLVALTFFGILCSAAIWRHRPILMLFFGLLAFLGAACALLPGPMRPVYRRWLAVGHFISKCINTVFLTVAYFLVITPVAIILRIVGKSPIPLKPDKAGQSYWITRQEGAQPRDRFIKRY